MAKQQVSLTIDMDVAEQFQRLFPNERSSYCNEMMRLRVASAQGDISGLKLDLLLHKEKELKERVAALNCELVGISEQIRIIKDAQNKRKEDRLKEEQERMRLLQNCSGCGVQMINPHVTSEETNNGTQFCKECFFNQHPLLLKSLKNGDFIGGK
jgi:hypothetical protein